MSPRLDPTLPPPFHELDEYLFQRLCASIYQRANEGTRIRVFGRRGQKQFGIDLYAKEKGSLTYIAAQCKCYEQFSPANLIAASDDFLNHIERWKERGVRRFIVFVAADVEDTHLVEQERIETRRFHNIGVEYELWAATDIWNELRVHLDLVRLYCQNEYWVNLASPPRQLPSSSGSQVEALNGVVAFFSHAFAEQSSIEVTRIRSLIDEGRDREALSLIQTFCDAPAWHTLPSSLKVNSLSLLATLELLSSKNLVSARQRITQIQSIDSSADIRLIQAKLLNAEGKHTDALSLLGSPSTPEHWHLRWHLLLDLGNADRVLNEITSQTTGTPPHPECFWARCRAYLLLRKVDDAERTTQEGLALFPNHFLLRLAFALITYLRGISEAFPAWASLTWPVPPHWSHIKAGNEVSKSFERAAALFAELSTRPNKTLQRTLKMWEIASIANIATMQKDAQNRALGLLNEAPDYTPAILWACTRNWEFDRTVSIGSLEVAIAENRADCDQVGAYVLLLLDDGRIHDCIAAVRGQRQLFADADEIDRWTLLMVQILSLNGQNDEARSLADSAHEPLKQEALGVFYLSTNCLSEEGAEFFAKRFNETGHFEHLAHACELKSKSKEWFFISENARTLISTLKSEYAIRLAVRALYETRRYRDVLLLLNENATLFNNSLLPADLRKLKTACLRQLGEMPKAISEFQQIVDSDPNGKNLTELFLLYQEAGDIANCTAAARRFLDYSDTPPEMLLGAIAVVRHRDPNLAEALWRRAHSEAGDDPQLLVGVGLRAFSLGLEHSASEILSRFPELADRSGGTLKCATFEEAVELIEQTNRDVAEASRLFLRGELPLHHAASTTDAAFTRMFYQAFLENEKQNKPLHSPILYIRNGSKTKLSGINSSDGIFLDLSTLLLAAQLDVLHLIEKAFECIHISADTAQLLLLEREQITRSQPSVVVAANDLERLFREGMFTSVQVLGTNTHEQGPVWGTLLGIARTARGVFITLPPLQANAPTPTPYLIPPEDTPFMGTIGDLVRGLSPSLIPDGDLGNMLSRLGSFRTPSVREFTITRGQVVVLNTGVARQLSNLGLLERFCSWAEVKIPDSELQEAETLLDAQRKGEAAGLFLERLLHLVGLGIKSGKYRTHRALDGPINATLYQRILLDAIAFGGDFTGPFSFDDRYWSKYQRIGKGTVVGILDILAFLRKEGVLSKDHYFALVSRLRKANARYIAVSSEELLYFLGRAALPSGAIEETDDLITLRRTLGACMLDGDRLRPVQTSEGQTHLNEMRFPLETGKEIESALLELWKQTERSEERVIAEADWLINNLWSDHRALREIVRPSISATEEQTQIFSASIAYLLFQGGIQLSHSSGSQIGTEPLRTRYNNWVIERLVTPCLKASPDLFEHIANAFRHNVGIAADRLKDDESRHGATSPEVQATRQLVAGLLCDLPRPLLNKMNLSRAEQLLWRIHKDPPRVKILDITFREEEIWNAFSRTVETGRATVLSADHRFRLRLTRGPTTSTLAAALKGPNRAENAQIDVAFLPLLSRSLSERRAYLSKHPEFFDLPNTERESLIEKITVIPSATARVAALEEARQNSISWFYQNLDADIRQRVPIEVSELIEQCAVRVYKHLRLPDRDRVEKMIADDGLRRSFFRIAPLPIPLPEAFINRFIQLSSTEAEKLLSELEAEISAPTERIQLIALAARSKDPTSQSERLKRNIEMVADWETLTTFRSVLYWANGAIEWQARNAGFDAPATLAIAWLHATRIYSAFCNGQTTPQGIREWFDGHSRGLCRAHLEPTAVNATDCSHPLNVRPFSFLLRGLAVATATATPDVISFMQAAVARLLPLAQATEGLSFCEDRSLLPNCLDSYLSTADPDALKRVLGEGEYSRVIVAHNGDDLEKAIQSLESSPDDASAWYVLKLISPTLAFPPNIGARLTSVFDRIDLLSAYSHLKTDLRGQVIVISQAVNRNGTDSQCEHVISDVLALAEVAALGRKERRVPLSADDDYLKFAAHLVDALLELSKRDETGDKNTSIFCLRSAELVRKWPEIAIFLKQSLPPMVHALPLSWLESYWRLTFTLRALA